jgi:putative transposase
MRTIKRDTFILNTKKQKKVVELIAAYSQESSFWIHRLRDWKYQALLHTPRNIRDFYVKQKYRSTYGLQARHWKLALQGACDNWKAYWEALFKEIRPRIARYTQDENERHYAYWLLSGYQQFSQMMQGAVPKPHFPIERKPSLKIIHFIRRLIKRSSTRPPTKKKMKLAVFDQNCYSVFEHKGKQYLNLMSIERGKRICIPLKGNKKIQGNISLIFRDGKCTVHHTEKIKPKMFDKEIVEAVDFGYTEVLTDTEGRRYGQDFGKHLSKASDELNEKMKKRHRLHALYKKNENKNPSKAKRIRKCNLGKKKLSSRRARIQATLENDINKGINDLFKTCRCTVLVTEDLRHAFLFDKPKSLNRRFSFWIKGVLQDRISFKALTKGFRHEQVHPGLWFSNMSYVRLCG